MWDWPEGDEDCDCQTNIDLGWGVLVSKQEDSDQSSHFDSKFSISFVSKLYRFSRADQIGASNLIA